jgi:hypothetical protein
MGHRRVVGVELDTHPRMDRRPAGVVEGADCRRPLPAHDRASADVLGTGEGVIVGPLPGPGDQLVCRHTGGGSGPVDGPAVPVADTVAHLHRQEREVNPCLLPLLLVGGVLQPSRTAVHDSRPEIAVGRRYEHGVPGRDFSCEWGGVASVANPITVGVELVLIGNKPGPRLAAVVEVVGHTIAVGISCAGRRRRRWRRRLRRDNGEADGLATPHVLRSHAADLGRVVADWKESDREASIGRPRGVPASPACQSAGVATLGVACQADNGCLTRIWLCRRVGERDRRSRRGSRRFTWSGDRDAVGGGRHTAFVVAGGDGADDGTANIAVTHCVGVAAPMRSVPVVADDVDPAASGTPRAVRKAQRVAGRARAAEHRIRGDLGGAADDVRVQRRIATCVFARGVAADQEADRTRRGAVILLGQGSRRRDVGHCRVGRRCSVGSLGNLQEGKSHQGAHHQQADALNFPCRTHLGLLSVARGELCRRVLELYGRVRRSEPQTENPICEACHIVL